MLSQVKNLNLRLVRRAALIVPEVAVLFLHLDTVLAHAKGQESQVVIRLPFLPAGVENMSIMRMLTIRAQEICDAFRLYLL